MPIVLSANSERALKATMEGLLQYLTVEPDTNMQDLVWTLLEERSVLSVRRAFAAQTVVGTRAGLEREIAAINGKQGLTTKSEHKKRKPKILGIFTGQGMQDLTYSCWCLKTDKNRCSVVCHGQSANRINSLCKRDRGGAGSFVSHSPL